MVGAPASAPGRIAYLDGLRGVAILVVLSHHAFGAWNVMFKNPSITPPYGVSISLFPPIAYGYLAVWLFFFISGYVIFITLEKCKTYSEFMFRRWSRLFPAMLICSLVIFATAWLFPERPMGKPTVLDLLSGLTFIDPTWWQLILGRPIGDLEGSFWSLFVEFRFYILFGALYFALGARLAVTALLGLFCTGLYARYFLSSDTLDNWGLWIALSHKIEIVFDWIKGAGLWGTFCDTLDYGMFASGIFFALYSLHKRVVFLVASVVLALLSAVTFGMLNPYGVSGVNYTGVAVALVIMLVIPLSCLLPIARTFWSNRLFVFFGFISYPLYLAHQNMMVAMIIKIQHAMPAVPPIVMSVIPIAVVVGLAWIVAKYVEPIVHNFLKSGKDRIDSFFLMRFALGGPASREETAQPEIRIVSDESGCG